MVRKNSESAHHSMVLESLVKVSLVLAMLAVAQTQQPQILILRQSTMMGPVSFCLGAPTRLHAITTLTLWKTTVLAWSWMSAVCAAAQVLYLSVVAMVWSPVLAIAMAMSSTIAVFAVVQAFQKELAIVKETSLTNVVFAAGTASLASRVVQIRLPATSIQPQWSMTVHAKNWMSVAFAVVQAFQKELAIVMEMLRTSAACVEGLGLLRQHVIALATWPTNVASVAAMDQLVRRAVQMQLPAILILQRSSTMVHANTSPARVAPIQLHAITMKMRPSTMGHASTSRARVVPLLRRATTMKTRPSTMILAITVVWVAPILRRAIMTKTPPLMMDLVKTS